MDAAPETNQRIAKLTPLADVLALIDREVKPVGTNTMTLEAARGRVLAVDVVAPALPAQALALIDGWALLSETTQDAGGYAPALLPAMPVRVDAGQPMPLGTDCVAPFDTVTVSGTRAEALAACNLGDGMLPAGGDCNPQAPMRRTGDRLRGVDVAVLAAAGITHVKARMPRIHLVAVRDTPLANAASRLIQADIEARGGLATQFESGHDLVEIFHQANPCPVIVIGGTGGGRNDKSVLTLAREGRVAVHGIALTPGDTAAFGVTELGPVLLLPGRLDAALAAWLTLGRRMLHRLDGGNVFGDPVETLTLSRKVASSVGLAELIPVRRSGGTVEPLAATFLPFSALTRADGWILVPAESEGYSAGSQVSVRPWP